MASHDYYGVVSCRLIVMKDLNRTNRIVRTGRSRRLTGPESTYATNIVWPDTTVPFQNFIVAIFTPMG
jgi:hypothetical protein